MKTGAIVLCGGKSSRMGQDKASLPFGPETMLARVIRLLSEVVDSKSIVVVAARGQTLPTVPNSVIVTHDENPDRGPLEGLAAGFRAAAADVECYYATSCDCPLLVTAFVQSMFERLGEHEIAVPVEGKFHHPLAAVYRPGVLAAVESLLASDRLRPRFLFDEVPTREIPVEDLRAVDPELSTLRNLNRPEDYQTALEAAGFLA